MHMKSHRFLLLVIVLLMVSGGIGTTAVAEEKIVATIYYSVSTTCGICVYRNQTLALLEQNYSDTIVFVRKNYDLVEVREEAREYGITSHPGMVITFQSNETVIYARDIPRTTPHNDYDALLMIVENYIDAYEAYLQETSEETSVDFLLLLLGIAVVVILGVVGFIIWKKEKS